MNEKEENVTVSEETVIAPTYEIVGVRFKTTGKIYYFDPQGLKLESGCNVIVETARGLEFGKVVIPNRIVGEDKVVLPLRPVLRSATKEAGEYKRSRRYSLSG